MKEAAQKSGEWLTIREAQEKLGVSRRTVWNYIEKGALIVAHKPDGSKRKHTLVSLQSIVNLCASDAQQIAQDAQDCTEKVAHIAHDEALLQATYRIGWLESRIESMQRALTEGDEAARKREAEARLQQEVFDRERQAKEETLEKERQAVRDLDRYLQDERQRRMAVEKEKTALEARIREMELPWWKKLFRPLGTQGKPATTSL